MKHFICRQLFLKKVLCIFVCLLGLTLSSSGDTEPFDIRVIEADIQRFHNSSKDREVFVASRKDVESKILAYLTKYPNLLPIDKVAVYERLKNIYGSHARFGTASREKVKEYSLKILEAADGKYSKSVIMAAVDRAHSYQNTRDRFDALTALYGLLNYIIFVDEAQLTSILLLGKDDDASSVAAQVRMQLIPYREITGQAILNMVKASKVLAARMKGAYALVFEAIESGAFLTDESLKLSGSTVDNKLDLLSTASTGSKAVTDITERPYASSPPSEWLAMLSDMPQGGAENRHCDIAYVALLKSIPCIKGSRSPQDFLSLSTRVRDEKIELLKETLFSGELSDWDNVRRRLVDVAINTPHNKADKSQQALTTRQLVFFLGTDFGYHFGTDKSKALLEAKEFWKTVRNRPSNKWKNHKVIEKYLTDTLSAAGLSPKPSRLARPVKVVSFDVSKDSRMKKLLIDLANAEKRLETGDAPSSEYFLKLIERIREILPKYKDSPEGAALLRMIRELTNYIDRKK